MPSDLSDVEGQMRPRIKRCPYQDFRIYAPVEKQSKWSSWQPLDEGSDNLQKKAERKTTKQPSDNQPLLFMFESGKCVIQNVKRDKQTEEPFDGLIFEGCDQYNDRTDKRSESTNST